MKWNCACGVENNEQRIKCAGCGWTRQQNEEYQKTLTGAIDQQIAPPSATTVSAEPQYKGIGGWLLLFCLNLVVISPVLTTIAFIKEYHDSSPYFEQFPGLFGTTVIEGILGFCFISFAIYAGIGLLIIRPGAVNTAKNFLKFYLGFQVVISVLPFMAGLPSTVNNALFTEAARNIVSTIIFFNIWNSYLNRSKRVRATYEAYEIEPRYSKNLNRQPLHDDVKLENTSSDLKSVSSYNIAPQNMVKDSISLNNITELKGFLENLGYAYEQTNNRWSIRQPNTKMVVYAYSEDEFKMVVKNIALKHSIEINYIN